MIPIELNNSYCLHTYIKSRPMGSDKEKKNMSYLYLWCVYFALQNARSD